MCKRAQESQTAESSPAKTMHSADLAEQLGDGSKRRCPSLGMLVSGLVWLGRRVGMKHVGRDADQDPLSRSEQPAEQSHVSHISVRSRWNCRADCK